MERQVSAATETQQAAGFPRGIAREVTPLSLWGGDTLIYRSIIVLSLIALPLVAAVNLYLRGTPSWPQLSLAGATLAGSVMCYALSRLGRRDIAAALLIGVVWCSATIYAFKSGYGMHSAAIFMYLPCILYTALFFGLSFATAELALSVAALVPMYLAEENGRLGGASAFAIHGTNFNFLVGVIITSIGTLIVGVVYHRRVEREAARVVAEAEQRRAAMEQARRAGAQLETANARLRAVNSELSAQGLLHERELARAKQDIDLFYDVVARDFPASLQALRAALAAPDGGSAMLLQNEIARMQSIVDALGEMGRLGEPALQRAPFELSAVAREVVDRLRKRHGFERVSFDIDVNLRADGDRLLVAALLRHLVKRAANACQREPEPLVRVGGGSRDGRAVFFVRDNGAGMDAARRQKMFRPFEPGRGIDDTVDIGLISARRIVERHGGELLVESAPGGGATYFFSLSA